MTSPGRSTSSRSSSLRSAGRRSKHGCALAAAMFERLSAAGYDEVKASMPTTSWPCSSSASTRCDPMKPAAPVTTARYRRGSIPSLSLMRCLTSGPTVDPHKQVGAQAQITKRALTGGRHVVTDYVRRRSGGGPKYRRRRTGRVTSLAGGGVRMQHGGRSYRGGVLN